MFKDAKLGIPIKQPAKLEADPQSGRLTTTFEDMPQIPLGRRSSRRRPGPFDAGTVVTQEALRINPLTAEVEADGTSSDPIPPILKGIPLKVRDIRVYVDKPDVTLNPTSCEESATEATIWSGGANAFSTLDDAAHWLRARFQAAAMPRPGRRSSTSRSPARATSGPPTTTCLTSSPPRTGSSSRSGGPHRLQEGSGRPVMRPLRCGGSKLKKHRRHVRHERNKGKKHQHRAKRGSVRP